MPNTANNLEVFAGDDGVEKNKEGAPEKRALLGLDVMGDIKVYLHQAGHLVDTIPLTTEAVNDEDIVAEFGLTEGLKHLFDEGDSAVHDEALALIQQGKLEEAVALIKNQEEDDTDQAKVITSDTKEIEQFFESLNHINDLIRHGTFDGLRKLSPGGKDEVLRLFNQSFEGEPSHNSVGDNKQDDLVKNHDCYVITEKGKQDLQQKIGALNMADKYKVIEGHDPQFFILQIHNRNIPFVCAQMVGEAANDDQEMAKAA